VSFFLRRIGTKNLHGAGRCRAGAGGLVQLRSWLELLHIFEAKLISNPLVYIRTKRVVSLLGFDTFDARF
jgi:hypothetical protein